MVDIITLVIVGIFGGVAALFVMFFILITRQRGKPRSEAQYYKSYNRNDGQASQGDPFKQGSSNQNGRKQPPFAIVSIAPVVIGIVVSVFFDPFAGFLIIFILPLLIRFIWMRIDAQKNKNKTRDAGR
jgi:phosphate/sulfate permease